MDFTYFVDKNYEEQKKMFQRAVRAVVDSVREYFGDLNIECIHYINTRIKSKESIIDKMKRKSIESPFYQLKDIAGIRIVCHNESDVDIILSFIRDRYKNGIFEDKKIKRSDGYRAHHIVLTIPILFMGRLQSKKVEIQIRTIAQDLFATLSHRDIYKLSTKLPESWYEKMLQLGNKLAEVDKIADELKKEWIKKNADCKMKDTLTAETIQRICNDKLNSEISLQEAMECLVELLMHSVKTISELDNVIDCKKVMEEVDDLYLELLERKSSAVEKISHGSYLYQWRDYPEFTKKHTKQLVVKSIKNTEEYEEAIYSRKLLGRGLLLDKLGKPMKLDRGRGK